jgi:hypothetical protein
MPPLEAGDPPPRAPAFEGGVAPSLSAIDATIFAFRRNVVVAASAGTGKTHRLTALYLLLTLGLTSMGQADERSPAPPGRPRAHRGHHLLARGGAGDQPAHRARAGRARRVGRASGARLRIHPRKRGRRCSGRCPPASCSDAPPTRSRAGLRRRSTPCTAWRGASCRSTRSPSASRRARACSTKKRRSPSARSPWTRR